MTGIYVASSWRNPRHPETVAFLASAGHEVYDFRNPPKSTGFSWREVDPDPEGETIPAKGADWIPVERYLGMLNHDRAIEGFRSDYEALAGADALVMVLPCGKSAHLELGVAIGANIPTAILLEDPIEPELMYRAAGQLCRDYLELGLWIDTVVPV